MIRFVDLRKTDIDWRFAFWDTVVDKFKEFSGTMAWDTWEEFEQDYAGEELSRYKRLCPEWAFKPPIEKESTMPTVPSFQGHWAFLSNFHPSRLFFNDRWYPTAEHAYQATKMTNDVHHDRVAACRTPGEAKRRGRQLPLRKDWEQIKDEVMLSILRAKFAEPGLARLLLETGDQELVEHNYWHDTYWGVCDGVGQNKLGQLLMQVRDELNLKQKG